MGKKRAGGAVCIHGGGGGDNETAGCYHAAAAAAAASWASSESETTTPCLDEKAHSCVVSGCFVEWNTTTRDARRASAYASRPQREFEPPVVHIPA